ncbi:MAG: hypothetical protein IT204_23070 [Fimbriimonadaceae bacterium]|nr:hypothetical protein [Fimbriimonadaceae bacterium]
MRSGRPVLSLTLLLLLRALPAAPPTSVTVLPAFEDAKLWYAAECSVSNAAPPGQPELTKAIHLAIPVDHTAGEPQYPIGWPRGGIAPAPAADWSGYDWLRFRAYCTSNREKLPHGGLGLILSMPDRGTEFHLPVPLVKDGWCSVEVPIERLSNSRQIARLQFNISESQWAHGDRLDVWFADLQLVKVTAPAVLALRSLERVLSSDAGYVVLELQVAGLPPGELLPARLVARSAGKEVAAVALQVRRGLQRLTVKVPPLPPGELTLTVQLPPGQDAASTTVTITRGPFGG